jgi:hypothetical protein
MNGLSVRFDNDPQPPLKLVEPNPVPKAPVRLLGPISGMVKRPFHLIQINIMAVRAAHHFRLEI